MKKLLLLLASGLMLVLAAAAVNALVCSYDSCSYKFTFDDEQDDCTACYDSETCIGGDCYKWECTKESETCPSDTSKCSAGTACAQFAKTYSCGSSGCTASYSWPTDNSCTSLCSAGETCSGGSCVPACSCSGSSCTRDYYSCDGCNEVSDSSCAPCADSAGYFCSGGDVHRRFTSCNEYLWDSCDDATEYCSGGECKQSCDYSPSCTQSTTSNSDTNCGATRPSTIACTGGCQTTTWTGGTDCTASGKVCDDGECVTPLAGLYESCSSISCDTGLQCVTKPSGSGKWCVDSCASANHKDSTWCGDSIIDPGTWCYGSNVMCSDGKGCAADVECVSGNCVGGVCTSCVDKDGDLFGTSGLESCGP